MSILDKGVQPLSEPEALQAHIAEVLAVKEPHGLAVDLIYRAVKALFDPIVHNVDRMPEGPCLFVGNHSLFALDGYILGPVLFRDLDRFAHALGDRFLFASPPLAKVMMSFGVALGHPEVCAALMRAGRDLLIFPGGAREAVKPASAIYQLQWRERYGFVRLAAEHGYTIMPFGTVGPDEIYGHLLEGEDLPESPIGLLLAHLGILTENTRRDLLPPIPVGALGTPFPKPQRCFMGFGEPIDLSRFKGRKPTRRQQERIRDQVEEQIETQIAEMMVARARYRGRESLLRRLLTV